MFHQSINLQETNSVSRRRLATAIACCLMSALSYPAFAAAETGSLRQPNNDSSASRQVDSEQHSQVKSTGAANGKEQSPAKPTKLGTITVTATARRVPENEVPMNIAVVPSESLQRSGAQTFMDYLPNLPGVNVMSQGSANNDQISIDGVTTGSQTGATVAIYVNGIPIGTSTYLGQGGVLAFDMALLGLNRIEVLHGPQGTLYGENAMGGVIRYITKKPDPTLLSGKISMGFQKVHQGGFGNTYAAAANIPTGKDSALRLNVFEQRQPGFIDAFGGVNKDNVNTGNTTGERLDWLISPSERFSLELTAMNQNSNIGGSDLVDRNLQTGHPIDELGNDINGFFRRQLFLNEPFHMNTQVYSATVKYDFNWATFESLSSYQKLNNVYSSDRTWAFAPLFATLGFDDMSRVIETINRRNTVYTQEFRLTSPFGRHFQWLAGVFYSHQKTTWHTWLTNPHVSNAHSPEVAPLILRTPNTYWQMAAYGNVTWKPTGKLAVTGGFRYTHEKNAFNEFSFGRMVSGTVHQQNSTSDDSQQYLFTAKYFLKGSRNVYVRVANGTRPGGPNPLAISPETGRPIPGLGIYQPDSLWRYEAGYHGGTDNGDLQYGGSLFVMRWTNIQQLAVIAGIQHVINGGAATIKGANFSASLRPFEGLRINFGVEYLNAVLTRGSAAAGVRAGDKLPNTPKWSGSMSADYSFAIGGDRAYVGARVRGVANENSGYRFSSGYPNFPIPGYASGDVYGGVQFGRVNIRLFVKNVADRHTVVSAYPAVAADAEASGASGPVFATPLQPRTFGMTLSVRLGAD